MKTLRENKGKFKRREVWFGKIFRVREKRMLLVCLVTNSRTLMIFKIGVLKISQYSQENTSINLDTVLKVCNFFI